MESYRSAAATFFLLRVGERVMEIIPNMFSSATKDCVPTFLNEKEKERCAVFLILIIFLGE